MKWFFFASFVAALICSVFWTAVIIFAIATSRVRGMQRGVALVVPLVFFIWGARAMVRAFRGVGLNDEHSN